MADQLGWDLPADDWELTKRQTGGAFNAGVTPDPWASAPDLTAQAPAAAASPAPAAPPAPAVPMSVATGDYTSQLDAIAAAPDPVGQAVAKDSLGRQLYQDLSAAGHEVGWGDDPNHLVVDGKAYEVAGGADTAAGWSDPSGGDKPPEPPPGQPGSTVSPYKPPIELYPYGGYKPPETPPGTPGSTVSKPPTPEPEPTPAPTPTPTPTPTPPPNPEPPPPPPTSAPWTPDTAPYVPEQIDVPQPFDLEGRALAMREQILGTVSPAESETDALIRDLLRNPSGLDDRTVEMLKAKQAEEAAVAAQAQDEELQHFGANTGLDSSPWLASARADTAWGRRAATIQGNRTVDLEAARTRTADRQAAAQLGQSWTSLKSNRQLQATSLAVDSVLRAAGESRDRFAINESLKQAAVGLGLKKDELVQNYIMHNIDDLTKRWGLSMGFQIDSQKLAQSAGEFQQDLMFRVSSLRQQDEQFQKDLEEKIHGRQQQGTQFEQDLTERTATRLQNDAQFRQKLQFDVDSRTMSDEQFKAEYGLKLADLQRLLDSDAWERIKNTYLSPTGTGG